MDDLIERLKAEAEDWKVGPVVLEADAALEAKGREAEGLRADQRKLDYVLEVLGIADTDHEPAEYVREFVERLEQAEVAAGRLLQFVEDFNSQFVCWGMMSRDEENEAVKRFVERSTALLQERKP